MSWSASQKKYQSSIKGREARRRYQQSEKGRAARTAYMVRRKAKLAELNQKSAEELKPVENEPKAVKIKMSPKSRKS